MELKEFIESTLTQIAQGVQGAIEKADGYDVNPAYDKKNTSIYAIKFDLSIESEKDGGVNIRVLRAGGVAEKSMNRISFAVDMTLPSTPLSTPPNKPNIDSRKYLYTHSR